MSKYSVQRTSSVGNPSLVNATTENDYYPGDTLFRSSFNDRRLFNDNCRNFLAILGTIDFRDILHIAINNVH